MKKILSLLIIAMLTLNLYACSNTDSTNNSTTRDTSTANAATPYTYEGVTFEIPTVWGEPEENDDSDNTYYFYPEGQNDKKHDTVPAMLMIDITDADYLTGMSQEEYRKAAVDAVKQLSKDVGIPADLKEIVKEEDLQFLSESALADACCPGNPRDTNVEEIKELYKSLL